VDETIDLAHFVGENEFSGIRVDEDVSINGDLYTSVTVVLNDIFYTFKEDPMDGQRSRLGEIFIDEYKDILDIHSGNMLFGELYFSEGAEHFIDLCNPYSGEVVIRLGTMDTDYDYPYFLFDYFPENLNTMEEDYLDDEY
jgi:hypothetical protein